MVDTIHLQGIGRVRAKKAKDFKVGEKFGWNYGYTSKILKILKETKTQIVFQTLSEGVKYERRLGKERLVAIG